MRNAIAVAALAVGLAFGTAQASFAQGGNVDGGAQPRSGTPTAGEQGAASASGSAHGSNKMMAPAGGKQHGTMPKNGGKNGMKKNDTKY